MTRYVLLATAILAVPVLCGVNASFAGGDQLYQKLARYPDAYIGNIVHFVGKVMQAVDDGGNRMLRIDISPDTVGVNEIVYVDYVPLQSDPRFVEGNLVRFCGKFVGIKSYKAVLGQTIQIPHVIARELEFFRRGRGRVIRLNCGAP